LPDVGRIKACVQNKMGQLSKGCLDTLSKVAPTQGVPLVPVESFAGTRAGMRRALPNAWPSWSIAMSRRGSLKIMLVT
jgi:hypothetical protein